MKDITWKLNLQSPPARVYEAIATDSGRAKFWSESAVETDGVIDFRFINGMSYRAAIRNREENKTFSLTYFDTQVNFNLEANSNGGTDLTLHNTNILESEYMDMYAGWLSVLFALKAAVDHQVDLRNHNPLKSWDQGYIEN